MRIDDQFMAEVGLDAMPENEKKAFMQHAEEELEVRVGHGVSANLTDAQLMEFDQISDLNSAEAWLNQNIPNFREIVEDIYRKFKAEILAERNAILGIA